MKNKILFTLFLLAYFSYSQERDSIITSTDTIRYKIELEEIILTDNGAYTLSEEQKRLAILKNLCH